MSSFVQFRAILIACTMFFVVGCNEIEPKDGGEFALGAREIIVNESETAGICTTLEDAGYVMPYGPTFAWYDFNMYQSQLILESPFNSSGSVAVGNPSLFVLVDWNIPSNLDLLPYPVSSETVDTLAEEAKNVCRIVQQEAVRTGIGPIDISVQFWDLRRGTQLRYGEGSQFEPTSHCDQIRGTHTGNSVGLNPEARTAGICPSLYVPN